MELSLTHGLLSEIEDINKQGIEVTPENFMISESASLFTISSRNGRDKRRCGW